MSRRFTETQARHANEKLERRLAAAFDALDRLEEHGRTITRGFEAARTERSIRSARRQVADFGAVCKQRINLRTRGATPDAGDN